MARNGDFGSDKAKSNDGVASDWKADGAPAAWHSWQFSFSKGAFTWDRDVEVVKLE